MHEKWARKWASRKSTTFLFSQLMDVNVVKKENEKISKYTGLRVELGRLWNMECVVVPIVIRALGAILKKLCGYLETLPGSPQHFMCQKIAVLGTEKILRGVLSRPN